MKLLRALAALTLSALALAAPAAAQTYAKTYAQVSSSSFSALAQQGAAASPGASEIAATGWSDVSGGCWQVYGNYAIDPTGGASSCYTGSTWNTGLLARSEKAVNQRLEWTGVVYGNGVSTYALLRYFKTSNGSNGYIVGVQGFKNSGAAPLAVFKVIDGALTSLATSSSGPTLSDSATYTFRMTAEQTNSTTTTLTVEVLNSSGTQVGTFSVTDTDTSLQNISGAPALFANGGSKDSYGTQSLRTYSGDAATSATSYSLTGPSTVVAGQVSAAFTVTPNGQPSTAVTVTPSDGAGGVFTPGTVTFSTGSSASQSFTYTPSAAGPHSVATTNSGGLADPAGVSILALTTLAVNSPFIHYSPLNWSGDAGRGGALWRSTWNPGAYLEMQFTTSSASSPAMNLVFSANSGTTAQVHIYLNGALADAYVTASGVVSLGSYLQPSTAYRLVMVLDRSSQTTRWNYAVNAVRVLGVQVDPADAFAAIPNGPWGEIVGDSISEGVGALGDGTGRTDNVYDYTFDIGQALRAQGYDYSVSANGGSGFLQRGDGPTDIPAYYSVSGGTYSESASRWDKVDQGVSVFDSVNHVSGWGSTGQEPAFVLVNYNYNEAIQNASLSDLNLAIQGWEAAERAAAPNAQIIMLVPPGLRAYQGGAKVAYANLVASATAAYLAANPSDTKTTVVDLGPSVANTLNSQGYVNTDLVHPNTLGQAFQAPRILAAVNAALAPAPTSSPAPRFRPGFH